MQLSPKSSVITTKEKTKRKKWIVRNIPSLVTPNLTGGPVPKRGRMVGLVFFLAADMRGRDSPVLCVRRAWSSWLPKWPSTLLGENGTPKRHRTRWSARELSKEERYHPRCHSRRQRRRIAFPRRPVGLRRQKRFVPERIVLLRRLLGNNTPRTYNYLFRTRTGFW